MMQKRKKSGFVTYFKEVNVSTKLVTLLYIKIKPSCLNIFVPLVGKGTKLSSHIQKALPVVHTLLLDSVRLQQYPRLKTLLRLNRNWGILFLPSFFHTEISDIKLKDDVDTSKFCQHSSKCDICTATTKQLNISDIQYFLQAHEEVIKSGKFNYEECRLPVNTRINLSFLRSWLTDYNDKRICDFLEYRFSLGANDFGCVLKDINKKSFGNSNITRVISIIQMKFINIWKMRH